MSMCKICLMRKLEKLAKLLTIKSSTTPIQARKVSKSTILIKPLNKIKRYAIK